MKRMMFGLSALLMLLLMTACSNDIDKIKKLTKEVEEKSADWGKEEWKRATADFYETAIHLLKNDLSEEEFKEADEVIDDYYAAVEESETYSVYKKEVRNKKDLHEQEEEFEHLCNKYNDKYKKKDDKYDKDKEKEEKY